MSGHHFKEHAEAYQEAVVNDIRDRSKTLAQELAPLLVGKSPEEAEAIFRAKLVEMMAEWQADAEARLARLPKVNPDDIVLPGDEWKIGGHQP